MASSVTGSEKGKGQQGRGAARPEKVDLFTAEEHRILSEWLGVEPRTGQELPTIDEALERLGFAEEPGCAIYSNVDAAVAFIVLESVEGSLPQWAAVRDKEVLLARDYRDASLLPERRVAILPRHLFTVNWADSGPGFSWPGAYYVTWVPIYERYVVTDSADTPEVYGYADIAIGHFGGDQDLQEGSREVITHDWECQKGEWCQGRWIYLFGTGIVGDDEANQWADEVWTGEEEW